MQMRITIEVPLSCGCVVAHQCVRVLRLGESIPPADLEVMVAGAAHALALQYKGKYETHECMLRKIHHSPPQPSMIVSNV